MRVKQAAYRDWIFFQPRHAGYRPKSRWFNEDRDASFALECRYNLENAEYQLHLATHGNNPDPIDWAKNFSIVVRKGRLKP